MTSTWQERAQKKRESILAAIPPEWRLASPLPSPAEQKDVTGPYVQQFLSPREIEITESDAVYITEQTTTGKWTAVEVVTAFCHRAALAHQLTNCLHEVFFDLAIARAKELDAVFAAGNGPTGPLHGLPVSFKDQFHVKGVETTMGYVGWIDTFEGVKGTGKERNVESELVREVKALGAVPYCKTSLPHTVMSGLTWNNIVGFTLNPNNRLMSCGGSSGGEGALISMRGSPIGFGTDIGGSIRIPSAFNGLYGIRPSFGRLPYAGAANSMPGQNTIPSVCGPLAPTSGALKLMLRSILSQQPWLHDPAVVEMPWRDELCSPLPADGSKLTFGLLPTDGIVNPQPAVRRAFETVKELILEMGHHVVEWKPPSHTRAIELAFEAFTADSGLDIWHHIGLSGETLQDRVQEIYGKQPGTPKTIDQVWDLNLKLRQYQQEYMDYWNSTAELTGTGRPVDAVLTPVAPFAALQFEKAMHVGYTPWVNTLDYTSVVFPVTKVDKTIDTFDKDYQPMNDLDKKIWQEYDPDVQQGTPVGLQLVGRRLQEEKILGIVELLSTALAVKQKSS
ncbi:amidase [Fonsecaea erecta]|uniref:amidase n=1 Tax=Fonsecaea erecta TaxID=1367422 RepID=A0A178Z8B7_9EURO|nr:amidase [Fonsecaea erecta]OAP56028.1 amidase [Fonsecaea erecta]